MSEDIIPKNLEECFIEIDKLWDKKAKNLIKKDNEEDFLSRTHHNLGRSMRNNWELWGDSDLAKYFKKTGVTDADYMSSLILRSYHRKLMGKELNLEEQIIQINEDKKSIQNILNNNE